jgi:rod shape-determining protein MreC
MGVINSLGIVGIIENTSPIITVISILNKKNHKSMPKSKSNHFGSLIWNGKSTDLFNWSMYLRLRDEKETFIVTGGQPKFSRKYY